MQVTQQGQIHCKEAGSLEPERQPLSWVDVVLAGGIAVGFFCLGLWRLDVPSKPIYDEICHSRTAVDYLAGKSPFLWSNPPLANLSMAVGILMFGDEAGHALTSGAKGPSAFSYRFPSLAFGAVSLLALYALARSLFNNRAIALLATFFLALDGLFFVQSRTGMTNIYATCFLLLGLLGASVFCRTGRYRWLLLAGAGLGCATAARWTGLWAWGLTLVWLGWHEWERIRAKAEGGQTVSPLPVGSLFRRLAAVGTSRRVGAYLLAMVVLPMAIYAAAYTPFVLQGAGPWSQKLLSWNWNGHGWGRVVSLQRHMWNLQTGLHGSRPASSPWWSWPLLRRPVWYHTEKLDRDTFAMVWATGNAVIWWASVPALVYAGWLARRDKQRSLALVALFGIGMWLVWAIQPREVTYLQYMLESIPFACIALAWIVHRCWQSRSSVPVRVMAGGYVGLVGCWFVFYYPLLTAVPVSRSFWSWHMRLTPVKLEPYLPSRPMPSFAETGMAEAASQTTKEGDWIAFSPTALDFGDVDQGTEKTLTVAYRNKGNGTLKILDASSTCGCAVALPSVREVPPRGSAALRVVFRAGLLRGPIRKTVTVRSNDPKAPAVALPIRAKVHPVFEVDPQMVNLGEVGRGKAVAREVVVKNLKGQGFVIEKLLTSHAELQAEVVSNSSHERTQGTQRQTTPRTEQRLRLTLTSKRNAGPFTHSVSFQVQRSSPPTAEGTNTATRLTVPVFGTITGPVRVSPPALFLGQVAAGEKFLPRKVTVTNTGEQPVEIRSVDAGDRGLKATVTTLTPGQEFQIALTAMEMPPPGVFQRTMRILTSESDVPIEVNLGGIVRK